MGQEILKTPPEGAVIAPKEPTNAELAAKIEMLERIMMGQKEEIEKLKRGHQIKRDSMSIIGEEDDEEKEVDPRTVPPTGTFEVKGKTYKFLNARIFIDGKWYATFDILEKDDDEDLEGIVERFPNAVKEVK
jgi:hypothetical protein